MERFNVIIYDPNSKEFKPYDVIKPLVEWYKETKKDHRPVTREEFRKFIQDRSMYQWWSRCEYELILQDWPPSGVKKKIDIHWQVVMNIDIITRIVMDECLVNNK